MARAHDPLTRLPPELVLRILDCCSLDALANLTRTSRPWHAFIDAVHCDAIYASKPRPLAAFQCYTDYLAKAASPKDLCRRQLRLSRTLQSSFPRMAESRIITEPADPTNTWRFRPDFERRFIMSTSEFGGLRVNDMDSGAMLWSLPDESVGPYTHLEYSQGWACFNRLIGDTIEVWRALDTPRGHFAKVCVFDHRVRTRGFHCRFPHLCVVSDQGKGFVYDLSASPPRLMTEMFIQENASGHVDQDDEVVLWSMGARGYTVHSKKTGQLLGMLNPAEARRFFHITHPPRISDHHRASLLQSEAHAGDACLDRECLTQCVIRRGRNPLPQMAHADLDEDEWGAGMLLGDVMVGVSRLGRVFVTSNWRKAMTSWGWCSEVSAIVECMFNSTDFYRGGWLAVKNGRALVEVWDRIYVLPLPTQPSNEPPQMGGLKVHAITSTIIPMPSLPISWMGLFDDCLMFTQTMPARWTRREDVVHGRPVQLRNPTDFSKAIKILSFAPKEAHDDDDDDDDAEEDAGLC